MYIIGTVFFPIGALAPIATAFFPIGALAPIGVAFFPIDALAPIAIAFFSIGALAPIAIAFFQLDLHWRLYYNIFYNRIIYYSLFDTNTFEKVFIFCKNVCVF